MIVTLKENNYDQVVEQAQALVLLDVWAPWCSPCKAIEPLIAEVARHFESKLVVAKLNADEEPGLAQGLGIGSLPTLRLLHRGKVVFQSLGVVSRDKLFTAIESALKVEVA